MSLFTERVACRADWSGLFQSIPAFTPLGAYILEKENLPPAGLERLTPGTNAVFRAGDYVLKIYAPPESGVNQSPGEFESELFAARRAGALGVSTPEIVASGVVEDRYRFAYTISEYIDGTGFAEAAKTMSDCEKTAVGRKLRGITDRMNTPCEPFNDVDVINDKGRSVRWGKYPESFKCERLAYIKSRCFGENVFVHGDLCADNILCTPNGGFCVIDFADAALAPAAYEHALVAAELFGFDAALLRGYFCDYAPDEIVNTCFDGLLIHDFGGDIIETRVCKPAGIRTLDDLRRGLELRISS